METDKKYKLITDKGFVPVFAEDEWTDYLNYNKLTKSGEPTIVYAMPSPDAFNIFEQIKQGAGVFF